MLIYITKEGMNYVKQYITVANKSTDLTHTTFYIDKLSPFLYFKLKYTDYTKVGYIFQ